MDYAIILGGGKGLRMGADVPKQFLEVGGIPILMRTIMRFREYGDVTIILVLPHDQQDYWRELCRKHHFSVPCEIADGGQTRFHSILNGLSRIPDDAEGVVAVHDGVRPFPSVEVIRNCYETARQTGTAVPVIPVVETVRHLDTLEDGSIASATVPRSEYRLVQTPQAFDIQLHKQAYRQPYDDNFTDDASVVESFFNAQCTMHNAQYFRGERKEERGERIPLSHNIIGGFQPSITLVEGNRENIKITTPFDLIVAEAIVKDK